MRKFWSRKEIENCERDPILPSPPESPAWLVKGEPISAPPKPPDPEPDLSTKPADIIGYCFGFACPKKHVQNTFESVTVDGYKERLACNACGAVAKPCVVKRIAEATWRDWQNSLYRGYSGVSNPYWGWGQTSMYNGRIMWTRYEFFHYLELGETAG